MSKTIVIVGVTGIQGTSVAETFLSTPGWKVRGITRNPTGDAATSQAVKGVEIVKGDLDNKQSLLPAFEGATVIFANTDYWAPLWAALASPDVTGGLEPRKHAYDREFEQGMNIAEAAAAPATLKTLERFVYSSLSDATKCSNGKFTQVYHNDVKANVERAIHAQFPELGKRMSGLHVGHYITNWHVFPPARPRKQPDGSFLIERTFGPGCKIPFVHAHKDTGPFVKALVDLPAGKNVSAHREELTWPEFSKIWGETLGVKASYRQVSFEEHFAGIPDALKGELTETFLYADEFGLTGGNPEILTADQLGIKVLVPTVAEYVRDEDWSSVL